MQGLFIRSRYGVADALDVAPPCLHQPPQVDAGLRTTCSRLRHEIGIVFVERCVKAPDHSVWRPALMKSAPLTIRVAAGFGTSSPLILNALPPPTKVTEQN